MKINVIKDLIREKNNAEKKLSITPEQTEEYDNLCDKVDLLKEIIEYIKGFTWVKHVDTREKIKFLVESDFDFELYMDRFEVDYTSAKNLAKYCYKLLYQRIGENTLKLIKDGYLAEARSAFYVGIGKVKKEDYVIQSLIDILPDSKFTAALDLEECRNELTVLSNMSVWRLKYYDENIDKDKMAYVLHLLEGKSKKADLFRPYLIAFLQNKLTYEDLLEIEEEIKQEQMYL